MTDELTRAYELLKLAEPIRYLSGCNQEQWKRWRDEWVEEFEKEITRLEKTKFFPKGVGTLTLTLT